MLPIASLLNPSPVVAKTRRSDTSNQMGSISHSRSIMAPPAKKAKMTKDAIVLVEGKVYGQVRYPPCEVMDDKIFAEHRRIELHPSGNIAKYHRHIPYTSEKKSFLKKTGRESFEVFQYSFMIPGNEKPMNVMWDYNIGLVRMTSFFKACGYPKTQPAKMMSYNPGLRDISHSITGGALAAQGYWVPYGAAKAAAATFCYQIRYAMTPLFGHDFPQTCIKPGDEGFGSMAIDPKIIQSCTEQAARYYAMAIGSSGTSTPRTSSPSCFESRLSTPPSTPSSERSMRSRLALKNLKAERKYAVESDDLDTAIDSFSGDSARTSPTTVNPYLKQLNKPYFEPDYQLSRSSSTHKWQGRTPSPRSSWMEEPPLARKRDINDINDNSTGDENSLPPLPPKLAYVIPASRKRKRCIHLSADEITAAYALVELNMADSSGCVRRRASF